MVVFIKVFCLFLALFVCLTWSKTAFVVDNGNGGFVVVDSEPANGKYVAGANFTNSINQTGYPFFFVCLKLFIRVFRFDCLFCSFNAVGLN